MKQNNHQFMRAVLFIALFFTCFLGVAASTPGLLTETNQEQIGKPDITATEGVGKYTVKTTSGVGTIVYCRINSGEWFKYKKPLVFTEYGTYVVEAYAVHDLYAPSDIVSKRFTVDESTGENLVDSEVDNRTIILYDGFKYKLNETKATAALTRQNDKMCSGDLIIPPSITHDGVTYSVTEIESWACYGTNTITSVQIPSTVRTIGLYAFNACPALRSIEVDPANPNYCDEDGVLFNKDKTYLLSFPNAHSTHYTIPDGVTMIYYSAFWYGYDLETVTIPNTVLRIATSAFNSCASLKSVELPASLQIMDVSVFGSCGELESVTLSPTYSQIPGLTFSGCYSLESIVIPGNVTYIADLAFENCTHLTSVTLCEGIEYIQSDAFSQCRSLPSITIPSSVVTMGDNPFYRCTGMAEINVDPANPNFCVVDGVLYSKDLTRLVTYPLADPRLNYDILPTTQVIDSKAFASSQALQNINIPNGVTTIGEYAFAYIESLNSINIPPSVTEIPGSMLAYCNSLEEFTIPGWVTSIGGYALNAKSMMIVNCLAETPPTIARNCFHSDTYKYGTLFVPSSSLEAYQSANEWSRFVTIKGIFAGDADGDGVLTISDVTSIIDYILSSSPDSFYSVNADVDGDGVINISDVTALIDLILKGD